MYLVRGRNWFHVPEQEHCLILAQVWLITSDTIIIRYHESDVLKVGSPLSDCKRDWECLSSSLFKFATFSSWWELQSWKNSVIGLSSLSTPKRLLNALAYFFSFPTYQQYFSSPSVWHSQLISLRSAACLHPKVQKRKKETVRRRAERETETPPSVRRYRKCKVNGEQDGWALWLGEDSAGLSRHGSLLCFAFACVAQAGNRPCSN